MSDYCIDNGCVHAAGQTCIVSDIYMTSDRCSHYKPIELIAALRSQLSQAEARVEELTKQISEGVGYSDVMSQRQAQNLAEISRLVRIEEAARELIPNFCFEQMSKEYCGQIDHPRYGRCFWWELCQALGGE